MSRRWKIVIAAAILIGLALLYPLAVHNQAKSALADYRKQLQAQGEKLTVAEVTPHVTAAQMTAGQDLLGAIQMSFSLTDYPPAMRYITPGRAMVSWAQNTLPTSESSNVWPYVLGQVADHAAVLESLRTAAANPEARFNLDYSQSFFLLLPHLAPLKRAAVSLAVATLVELREGNPSNALEDLKACVALNQPLAHEPIEISQLVRIAIGQIAVGATWELLQYPGWSDEQLVGLQTEWSSFNFLDGVPPSLEMERAFGAGIFEMGRGSISNIYNWSRAYGPSGSPGTPTMNDLGQFLANPKDGYEAFMDRYPRYWAWKRHWSYVEELYNLQCQEAALDCARTIQKGGDFAPAYKKLNTNLAAIENLNTNAIAHFYLGGGVNLNDKDPLKIADTEMARRMVVTAIALKRYQIQSGKYPADLKALVPDYLAELPVDLMDGKPLRYHPNADGTFLLYSVGEDGEDNGGDPTPTQSYGTIKPPYPPWLWWKGRDAVWPMPAAPAETKAYKEKLIAELNAKDAPKKAFSRLGPPTSTPPVTNTN